jgi:type I restriction enzyme, S subunit
MSFDAQQVSLADICSDVSYGYTESASTKQIGPKFLRITDIQGGALDWDSVPFCPASDADIQKYSLAVGDIVIARTGNSTGENAQISKEPPSAVFASYLIRFRPDAKRVNPFYVGYQLRAELFRTYVLSVRSGSAQPGANAKQLGAFLIQLISRPLQDCAVDTLRALDDRIALLRETNATLEAIAQALFKSWFVDFDPVRAKLEGRAPEGMDEATAALFPDGFEESGLGLVPRGWRVGALQDLLLLQRGFDLPSDQRMPGDYPIIAASGPSGTHNVSMAKAPGVVTGRSGVLGRVFLELDDYWPLNTTLWVKEFRGATPCYAYELLSLLDLKSFNAGSAVPTLNRNHVHGLKYLVPPYDCVTAYESIAIQLHERARLNDEQARTLATLRDTLLPRLISGQLRLPEAL